MEREHAIFMDFLIKVHPSNKDMIRLFISLFFIIGLTKISAAQDSIADSSAKTDYFRETLAFISQVKKVELSDATFTLAELPKFACFAYTVDDSVTFSKTEMEQIAEEINNPKIKSWKSILNANIRFLGADYMKSISIPFRNPKRETKLFNKYFGGCFHNFSAPIFLRNYTLCLFYVDRMCAAGKSSGELQVFEKRNGVWEQLTSRCEWTE